MIDTPLSSTDTLLRQLSSNAYNDEADCLEALLPYIRSFKGGQLAILAVATRYVEAMRAGKAKLGVEAFLQEYGLNTHEGLALLRLAEALLRIPDAETADALIDGNIKNIKWKHQKEHPSTSRLMRTTHRGLLAAQKILHMGSEDTFLSRLVAKAGDPLIRTAIKRALRAMGAIFIMGETLPAALRNAAPYARKGYLFSYDILGEGARSHTQAEEYKKHYLEAIQVVGQHNTPSTPLYRRSGVSVKLSALHPRFELLKYNKMMEELLPTLITLASEAQKQGIVLTIDAEEASRLDITLALFTALLKDKRFDGFDGLAIAIQSYQKRALPVLKYLSKLAEETKHRIPVRLVKGAYWDAEIKKAQMLGLEGFPVFTRKEYTDVSYLACAAYLLERPTFFYPQFATHNALTVASIEHIAKGREYEFQRLQGMGEQLYNHILVASGTPCRIYAPVGSHTALLAYLIRRLLENGASTSFMHKLSDPSLPIEALLKDPIRETFMYEICSAPAILLPAKIYGDERLNSSGLDVGNRYQMYSLYSQLRALQNSIWIATPLIAGEACQGQSVPCYQPSNMMLQVGEVTPATLDHVEQAMQAAQAAFPAWSAVPVEQRAKMLDKLADILEENTQELFALCMREAGKSLVDSIAEVREAVDFCRYYAAQARIILSGDTALAGPAGEKNRLSLHPRGVFVCISPWNFPLAILTGQIVAALVTGNTVVAKPANQTSLIAHRMMIFMYDAGIPKEVVHLLPGEGKLIGAALVKDVRTAGVVFTGSTEVARFINQSLAGRDAPICPFIAETGGQNCMIVDSSALLEQAVDDIIISAFHSAGQRCSALRVLYIQEDIAEPLIALLIGAMQELQIGESTHFSTDIGPVIDAAAQKTLQEHAVGMEHTSKLLYRTPFEASLSEKGCYIAPHLFEIASISVLEKEVFGPMLHIIRFKGNKLQGVVNEINSTGYGLTLGIFSRIEERISFIATQVRAGNIYVNRSMIGATVGVQPFGGEGLSGTGPKAGGPHYLTRFCTERTLSVNTAAIGGNVELLS